MFRTLPKTLMAFSLIVLLGQSLGTPAYAEEVAGAGIAGILIGGFSGDGGRAVDARLQAPNAIAIGPDGTVFISDAGNYRVRAVAPDGTISTVAGTGEPAKPWSPIPDGTPATSVELGYPTALAVGGDGTLYIADQVRARVLARRPDGRVSVYAGVGHAWKWTNGDPNGYGDGGLATHAFLPAPAGLAIAPDGTLYVSDLDLRRVREITPDGVIHTVAGTGDIYTGDTINDISDVATPDVNGLFPLGGSGEHVPLLAPATLSLDADGTLWILDDGVLRSLRHGVLATITMRVPKRAGVTGSWGRQDHVRASHLVPGDILAMTAGPDGVYAFLKKDESASTLIRLNRDGSLKVLAHLDFVAVTNGYASALDVSMMLVTDPGSIVVVDREQSIIYSLQPPPPPPATHHWPIQTIVFAAMAVLTASALLAIHLSRRKRRGQPARVR